MQVLCRPQHARALQAAGAFLKQAGAVAVRLHSLPGSQTHLRLLKAAHIGRLVTVQGSVVRISTTKPMVRSMAFQCTKCGGQQERECPDGRYMPPTACTSEGCRARQFTPLTKAACCVNWQQVRVQVRL